jgi:DsbC/DsbD-like thiol-disulfide interchange protein
MNRLPLVLLSLGLAAGLLPAQPVSSTRVSVFGEVLPPRILPGSTGKLILTLVMAPGWHINAHGASAENVIPTEFSWSPPPGFTVIQIQYPNGEPVKVTFQDEPLVAYQDEVQIVVDFKVGNTVTPGSVPLVGEVAVQACSDEVCLAPSDLPVSVPVDILRPIRLKKKTPR